ncbi:hypothetical protein N1F89_07275 [Aquibium sp. A9E412]|uniref:hypothetical protein n=1 Tax=Aquibium sp. A9E412 TaxID=2976767 RepID=UPI0025B1F699|nr:hypothetical protein [Aquibium sp. A9E412]MDN2566017.1 hypothetical protein [Aquibium sp. A9E412]
MRTLVLLLGLFAVNLAGWSGVWWMATQPVDTAAIQPERTAGRALDDLGALPGDEHVLDVAELTPVQAYSRPLFARNRKPWQPPKPPPAKKPPVQQVAKKPPPPPVPPPPVRLVGVSFAPNMVPRALLRHKAQVEPIWVIPGDNLQGWTVSRIDAQSIELKRGNRKVAVSLYPSNGATQ